MTQQIIVLGAGPAGAAVALGLKDLGYEVTVIYEPRPFKSVEGVSSRVLDGFKFAGLQPVLQHIPPSSPRNATWNGVLSQANSEYLVDRQQVDQDLVQALSEAHIRLINARVTQVNTDLPHSKAIITLQHEESIEADFVVEARGRSAPSAHLQRLRGPETLSLLQHWESDLSNVRCTPMSAAVSLPEGWAWMAKTETGQRYLQLTLEVKSTALPPKEQLADFCAMRFRSLPQAADFIAQAHPVGQPYGRTSTPILCRQNVGHNWLRVGDAAMAVDPLSGNGIFQAMSSALQAPAVINTLLQHPERVKLAQDFYQRRVEGLFYRFARIGRDFYRMETQWPEQAFWTNRQQWPDDAPMHQSQRFDQLQIKTLPVVNKGLIEAKEVVVSPDQPLGIWHLAGIELAPLLKQVQAGHAWTTILNQHQLPPTVQQLVKGWCSAFNEF